MNNLAFLQLFSGDSSKIVADVYVFDIIKLTDHPLLDKENIKTISKSKEWNLKIPTLEESCQKLSTFTGIEFLLFSLFVNEPLALLGQPDETLEFLLCLYNLLPPNIAKFRTFNTYLDRIVDNFNWIGLPPNEDSLKILEKIKNSHTIVSVSKKRIVALESCKFTNELAKFLELFNENEIKQSILDFYRLSIQTKSLNDISLIASEISREIDDAEFIQKISHAADFLIESKLLWR